MSENKVNLHSHLINHCYTIYIVIYSSLTQITVKRLAGQTNHFSGKKKVQIQSMVEFILIFNQNLASLAPCNLNLRS